mmetsp:Transcript_13326/g.35554  ORF Transcript_13326/g.35554 Transcript_13326/m.35554 type:complete len:318 (-) Transcript_13326:39-992(-)
MTLLLHGVTTRAAALALAGEEEAAAVAVAQVDVSTAVRAATRVDVTLEEHVIHEEDSANKLHARVGRDRLVVDLHREGVRVREQLAQGGLGVLGLHLGDGELVLRLEGCRTAQLRAPAEASWACDAELGVRPISVHDVERGCEITTTAGRLDGVSEDVRVIELAGLALLGSHVECRLVGAEGENGAAAEARLLAQAARALHGHRLVQTVTLLVHDVKVELEGVVGRAAAAVEKRALLLHLHQPLPIVCVIQVVPVGHLNATAGAGLEPVHLLLQRVVVHATNDAEGLLVESRCHDSGGRGRRMRFWLAWPFAFALRA